MNYRHHFHAGGPADVLKHAVLVAALRRLLTKPKPLRVLDSHAGAGSYELEHEVARRTGENLRGVARLWAAMRPSGPARELPEVLADLMRLVAACNPDGQLRVYPGSPRLARMLLRPGDRLAACELHAAEADRLHAEFRGDPQVGVHMRDGWEAIGALLPPPERRGLVVIDPPYERPDEFATALAGLRTGHARWPTGCFLLWYPIKGPVAAGKLHAAMLTGTIRRVLCVELRAGMVDPGDGSGVLVINPPWQLDAALATAMPVLAELLGEPDRPGSARVEWLVGE